MVKCSRLVAKMEKACCNSQVEKENQQKKEMMATNNNLKGLERIHNQRKRIPKEAGIKRISDEEFQKDMVEIRVELNHVKRLLQESEEGQIYGWTMNKKKVRWNSLLVNLR